MEVADRSQDEGAPLSSSPSSQGQTLESLSFLGLAMLALLWVFSLLAVLVSLLSACWANIEKCDSIRLNVVRGYVHTYTKSSYS